MMLMRGAFTNDTDIETHSTGVTIHSFTTSVSFRSVSSRLQRIVPGYPPSRGTALLNGIAGPRSAGRPWHRVRPVATTLRRIAPVFITTDLVRALSHYERLGFSVEASEGGDYYGFVRRDGLEIHLAMVEGVIDFATNNCCAYLWVDDASALYEEWTDAMVDGRVDTPVSTDYGLTEGAHVDPDGNLIRFGSPP